MGNFGEGVEIGSFGSNLAVGAEIGSRFGSSLGAAGFDVRGMPDRSMMQSSSLLEAVECNRYEAVERYGSGRKFSLDSCSFSTSSWTCPVDTTSSPRAGWSSDSIKVGLLERASKEAATPPSWGRDLWRRGCPVGAQTSQQWLARFATRNES